MTSRARDLLGPMIKGAPQSKVVISVVRNAVEETGVDAE